MNIPITEIISGLYQGTLKDASNYNTLTKHNITHVVSCIQMNKDDANYSDFGIEYWNFPLYEDLEDEITIQDLSKIYKFVSSAIKKGSNVII